MVYAPHNVQVAPDNLSVWVTANVSGYEGHGSQIISSANAHGEEENTGEADEIIVINPKEDRILKRIPVATGAHLAHVVVSPDGALAYITGQKSDAIYKINARTYQIEKTIDTPSGSEPHGLRIASDGKTAYVAMLQGKALGMLDLITDELSMVSLDGAAVQTGVTPDGQYAVVSLYDTKKLAIYRVADKTLSYVELPQGAKGPIQMYSTPDSQFVYLADQGYYFEQPTSDRVYKIDLVAGIVVKEIRAGSAPHGVVVSPDGAFVYVTNLLSDDVSVIDTSTDTEVGRIPVGKEPNGVSFWTAR